MSNTHEPRHFGRRGLIVGATAIGLAIGAAGLAGAAQSALHLDSHSSSRLTGVLGVDDTTDISVDGTIDDNGTDDTTDGTLDDNGTDTSIDDNGVDDSTDTSVDDHGNDSDDDDTSTSTGGITVALPEAFTKTYTSAGGDITVTWTGTAFVLVSVDAASGFQAEINDQAWDRIRVDFRGSVDTRIEVRLSDDTNTIRVRID